jgi:hypothetical protein
VRRSHPPRRGQGQTAAGEQTVLTEPLEGTAALGPLSIYGTFIAFQMQSHAEIPRTSAHLPAAIHILKISGVPFSHRVSGSHLHGVVGRTAAGRTVQAGRRRLPINARTPVWIDALAPRCPTAEDLGAGTRQMRPCTVSTPMLRSAKGKPQRMHAQRFESRGRERLTSIPPGASGKSIPFAEAIAEAMHLSMSC